MLQPASGINAANNTAATNLGESQTPVRKSESRKDNRARARFELSGIGLGDIHLILDVIQDAGWRWRPVWMADYLSEDLRIRVIEAVEAGSSRRGAAARFGVSVSSAIRWVDVWRRTGRTAPYPRGGDRRSGRIEGAAAFLLAKVEETPDITLAELQALLKERDLSVGTGTVWRFFDRHGISFKKNRARRRAGAP